MRVPALAVLLFAILLTHGVHGESVQGHLSTSATASAVRSADGVHHAVVETAPLITAEADYHRGGHEPSHPGQHCASGQPQQSSFLASPCFAASVRESTGAGGLPALWVPTSDGPMDGASTAALRAASVVRQV
ncbi:hypothetical protein ACIBAG_01725 [Streptomyces sp. NPDC051243]|uniref:hypothetical protein n=1 Tax=Streptomyces sp. NPDC051243 TaxID=3365646 RepID=UPI0037A0C4C4